jgi:hypothetical protein
MTIKGAHRLAMKLFGTFAGTRTDTGKAFPCVVGRYRGAVNQGLVSFEVMGKGRNWE